MALSQCSIRLARALLACCLAMVLFAGIIGVGIAAAEPVAPAKLEPRPEAGSSGIVLAADGANCIFRCRVLREECSQDNASRGSSDNQCWSDYATCRSRCGGDGSTGGSAQGNGQGTSVPPVVAPAVAEEVQLSPSVVAVGKWAEGLTYDGNWVWVAESGQRTIAKVDIDAGRVIERVKVGRLPVDLASPLGEGDVYAMVSTDKKIWGRGGVVRRSTVARLSECPEAMIAFGQRLWVVTLPECSSVSSRLVRIDPDSGRQKASGVLGQWGQTAIGYDSNIWIAHARAPALTVVNVNSLGARTVDVAGASFWSLAASGSHIFAGGREGDDNDRGLVVMLDPRSSYEVARASFPARVAELATASGHVIAIGANGTIWVLSADTLALQRTITLTSGQFDARDALVHPDGRLLISTTRHNGENGAILVVSGWQPDGYATGGGVPGAGPSFDCVAARSDAEQTICSDPLLSRLERELSQEYQLVASNITSAAVGGTQADVARFRREQRDWLGDRNSCGGDRRCLLSAYRSRLGVLREQNKPE